jgi:hypothetical protein
LYRSLCNLPDVHCYNENPFQCNENGDRLMEAITCEGTIQNKQRQYQSIYIYHYTRIIRTKHNNVLSYTSVTPCHQIHKDRQIVVTYTMLASISVDLRFDPRSYQTINCICCFLPKHTTLRSANKYCPCGVKQQASLTHSKMQ